MIRSYYLKGGRNKRASKRAARIGKEAQLYRNPKKEDVHFEKEYCGQNKLNIMISDIAFSDNMTLDLGGITAQIFHMVSPHSDDTICVYVPEYKNSLNMKKNRLKNSKPRKR